MWATLICPPSVAPILEDFVHDLCGELGVAELHMNEIDKATRASVVQRLAAFLAMQEIIWVATVIDSELFPAGEVGPWREQQAEIFQKTWERSERRGTMHPYYQGVDSDQIRRLLKSDRLVPLPLFVQYGITAPRHIHDCVQAAIYRYEAPRWQRDWRQPRLIFDRKDVRRTRGEEMISQILFPILASARMTLTMPLGYQDANHPIHSLRASTGRGIEVPSFFGGKPEFADSAENPLLQMVDAIAWIAGRALLHRHDSTVQAAYAQLRLRQFSQPNLHTRFRFMARREFFAEDLHRYRHLVM